MDSINFQQANFLTSAAKLSQLPPDTGAEVAFVGRSNVGKSSALNTLTQQKNLARTSKTPGRTQLINFFDVADDKRLVDLPGYGYAKVSQSIKDNWGKTLDGYLSQRQCLKGIVLLMDIRHPLREFDEMMLDWCQHYQIPLHILLTKADKLSRNGANQTLFSIKKQLPDNSLISIQVFSSLKKQGIDVLEQQLYQWLDKKNPRTTKRGET